MRIMRRRAMVSFLSFWTMCVRNKRVVFHLKCREKIHLSLMMIVITNAYSLYLLCFREGRLESWFYIKTWSLRDPLSNNCELCVTLVFSKHAFSIIVSCIHSLFLHFLKKMENIFLDFILCSMSGWMDFVSFTIYFLVFV